MVREPRWLVHRSEETLSVKVGSFYAATNYRIPAMSEAELKTWFRRRRWQGWAAVLPLVTVSVIAALWIGSGIVLGLSISAVVLGWSVLSGNTPHRFQRAFPDARFMNQRRGANAISDIDSDGTAVVQPSGTFKSYRLTAEDAGRFLIWRRRMWWYSMLCPLPLVPACLLAWRLELTSDTVIGMLLTVLFVSGGASLYWTAWRFGRDFPAAVQIETLPQSRFIADLSEQWFWKPTGLVIQGVLFLLLGAALWRQFLVDGPAIGFGGYVMAAFFLLFAGISVRVVLYRLRQGKSIEPG